MLEGIKCQSCGKEIAEDEVFAAEGKTLCENCYIDVGHRIRVCDPWGVRSKQVFRDSHGLEGTDGLTDLQKEIYDYIQEKGKATKAELMGKIQAAGDGAGEPICHPSSLPALERQEGRRRGVHCALVKT